MKPTSNTTEIGYRQLANLVGLSWLHNELKKALTHKSFYPEKEEDKSNSRYIFLGMYAFKGRTSELLFSYVPGSGTRLQHYLGNLFREEYLLKVYEKYMLEPLCRFGQGLDAEKQKHLFVYGFLGFLLKHLEKEQLDRFILLNFLEHTSHLMPGNRGNRDLLAQCRYFSKISRNKYPRLLFQKTEQGETECLVHIGGVEISRASSKSFRYARKKALKAAILLLSAAVREETENDPEYVSRQRLRESAAQEEKWRIRSEKIEKYLARQAKRLQERKIRVKLLREEAAEREMNRKQAKAKAKARAEARKLAEEKEAKSQAKMSARKRRHIQDKKK